MDEEWKPIDGFPDYLVSSLGRVKSLARTVHRRSRPLRVPERIIKPAPDTHGYLSVALTKPGGGRKSFTVHRLVLTAFSGPRPPGGQCRHLNGIQTDNRLANLRWGTPAENTEDNIIHGVTPRGSRHALARLTEQRVAEIRQRLANGETLRGLADDYGVSKSAIALIKLGRTWRHVRD